MSWVFYSLCKLALTFVFPVILSVYLSNIRGKKRRRNISKNKMPSLARVSFFKMFFLLWRTCGGKFSFDNVLFKYINNICQHFYNLRQTLIWKCWFTLTIHFLHVKYVKSICELIATTSCDFFWVNFFSYYYYYYYYYYFVVVWLYWKVQ